jgi:pSer/pThr/pTyr-binding forkhead associated (FHA) protein
MIATVVLALRLALAIILYGFLAWAFYTLLQELQLQGNKLSAQKKLGITFYVKTEDGRESTRHFSQPEIMLGRDSNCDFSVIDDTLSAHHARITFHHGQWWLEDLNSTNGTYLNREKLHTPAVIITGDEFKCGNTVFSIRIDADDKLSPSLTF